MAANMLRDGKQNTANIAYEVGFNSEAAFNRAFKREYGVPPATWRRRMEEQEEAGREAAKGLPDQVVRYCTAKDGTRLAFSIVGQGPPLVKAANWLNHIEHDWKSPVWRHWLHEFTRGHTLIRYDERANGMSDWDTPEISFEAFVDDLECVVDCAGVEQFDLLAISQGASVAIAYAVRHPERVRKLVICGGYAVGWAARGDPEEIARREAMITLTEAGWGADHPAYRQLFTNLYIPEGTAEQVAWFNEVQRVSASPANAVRLQRALSEIDVRDLLAKVTTPTLIFHARDDQVVPFAAGEYLARHIPGSTFVPLEGENHILLEKEPAWHEFARVTRDFLGSEDLAAPRPEREPLVHQRHDCTARDGARIAYATTGSGPSLVRVPNWFNHLETDQEGPIWPRWFDELSNGRSLLWYDGRGHGASTWQPPTITADNFCEDLADVVDSAGLEQFDLFGIGHGAAVSLAYAANFPERVRRLVLCNPWSIGWARRPDAEDIERREAIVRLSGIGWDDDNSLYRDIYSQLYIPRGSPAQREWLNQAQRRCTSPENAVAIQMAMGKMDVSGALGRVDAPCLIFHARGDKAVPVEQGREVAGKLSTVKLVELDTDNHLYLPGEPAWATFTREMRAFLAD
jgi:pimeloyl-ACP methyl ester carboxylesterase